MSLFDKISATFNAASKPAEQQKPVQQVQQPGSQAAAVQAGMNDPANPTNKVAGAVDANAQANTAAKAEPIWQQELAPDLASQALFTPNMAEFQKGVNGMDFMKSVDPALAAKALGGDAAALQQLINAGAQAAFSTSATASQQLIEAAMKKRTEELKKEMQAEFRTMSAGNEARGANPAFSDPEVSPIFNDVQRRLAARFPEASPSEISRQSQEFLTSFATKILDNSPEARKSKEETTSQRASQSTDWMDWAGDEVSKSLFSR